METTFSNNLLSLFGYTICGGATGASLFYSGLLNDKIFGTDQIYPIISFSIVGLGAGLVMENSRPVEVIEEHDNNKVTKITIAKMIQNVLLSSMTPASIICASYIIASQSFVQNKN